MAGSSSSTPKVRLELLLSNGPSPPTARSRDETGRQSTEAHNSECNHRQTRASENSFDDRLALYFGTRHNNGHRLVICFGLLNNLKSNVTGSRSRELLTRRLVGCIEMRMFARLERVRRVGSAPLIHGNCGHDL